MLVCQLIVMGDKLCCMMFTPLFLDLIFQMPAGEDKTLIRDGQQMKTNANGTRDVHMMITLKINTANIFKSLSD